jgi:hypothetical protein
VKRILFLIGLVLATTACQPAVLIPPATLDAIDAEWTVVCGFPERNHVDVTNNTDGTRSVALTWGGQRVVRSVAAGGSLSIPFATPEPAAGSLLQLFHHFPGEGDGPLISAIRYADC